MEVYDTEEQQIEALKRWWKENGTSTIVGLTLGIAAIVGWNYWQSHKKDQANQASAIYDQLLKASDSDQNETIDKLTKQLQDQYPNTSYAGYASLFLAKAKVQKGDIAGAKEILKKLSEGSDKDLGHIARIRLVELMLASGEYEQGLQTISQVDQSTIGKFSDNYDELTGDLYVALDRLDEARTSYEKAQKNGFQSPLLKMKLEDLTASDKIATPK